MARGLPCQVWALRVGPPQGGPGPAGAFGGGMCREVGERVEQRGGRRWLRAAQTWRVRRVPGLATGRNCKIVRGQQLGVRVAVGSERRRVAVGSESSRCETLLGIPWVCSSAPTVAGRAGPHFFAGQRGLLSSRVCLAHAFTHPAPYKFSRTPEPGHVMNALGTDHTSSMAFARPPNVAPWPP
eukprot:229997-Chlamydomonas_euryale.AAC.1